MQEEKFKSVQESRELFFIILVAVLNDDCQIL